MPIPKDAFFKVPREVFKPGVFKDERFSEREAWLYLLYRAQFSEAVIKINGKPTKIKPGEIITSYAALAKKWGWTREKVKWFLNHKITPNAHTANTQGTTRVTLIESSIYTPVTPRQHPDNTQATPPYNKNVLNNKNVEKDNVGDNNIYIQDSAPASPPRHLVDGASPLSPPKKSKSKSYLKKETEEEKFKRSIEGKDCFGRYKRVWLSKQDYNQFLNALTLPILERCIEVLDSHIEQDPDSKKIMGAAAAPTFYKWVISAVQKEYAMAQKVNGNGYKHFHEVKSDVSREIYNRIKQQEEMEENEEKRNV